MSKAANEYRAEVQPDLSDLSRVIDNLDALWAQHGLDPGTQADLNIAVEEILSNVIRHGGGGQPIHLRVHVKTNAIRIEIQDRGVAFDPLQHPPPDINAPLAQRRSGGLGIFMTTKLMDKTRYQRRDDWNCFTMVKALGPRGD